MRPQTPATPLTPPGNSSISANTDAQGSAAPRGTSRRSFLGGTVAASSAALVSLPTGGLFAAGEQRLRVGLVGCGGRGTGAALQALEADPAVRVVALGDVFADQVASSAEVLGAAGERFDCPAAQRFVGQDAYRRVINSGVDIVLLAAPPHTRPLHLEAAVAAGKHVYCEKPVAIDAAGVVRAAAAAARSRANGLSLVSGFCFRRDTRMVEMVARIHDGAIGRPRLVQAHAAIGLPWRQPLEIGRESGEWPLCNWISFARFSGGHFVEQHVQAIDRAVWVMGDVAPLMAEGMASSVCSSNGAHDNVATGAIGDCPAATAVRYTFADGRTIEASIDRRERAGDRIVETVVGSAGSCDLVRGVIAGRHDWTAVPQPGPGRFPAAILALVGGVLSGRSVHDGDTMCRSTLMAVMGSMAAESGRPLAWNELAGAAARLA
ncbi:MAG: Gfo/Idh/MocA family oxidoreductase [Planctomycetia bacterium]|nr:Gfo/Idh/MocA family oxidoreductase [Planctomycetia bacterium]